MRTIRVFISSPGDVAEERERARSVVHQLRRRYAGRLDLHALLWEELPLQADMSFQQGIDVVLSDVGADIAVFILWSRLGSPTGPLMTGEHGRQYRSGTEREWDLMLRARERCQRDGSPPRPSIIVYTRQDEVSFEERLRGKPDDEKSQVIDQKRLVKQFIEEEFRDTQTGVNIRAYHSFDQPTTFAQQLRIHLTNLLDSMAGEAMGEPVWSIADQGPPFRGLDAFEYQHASIFFGREDEIVSIRTRLREQACSGCAFVLISGPSGSGKSSLARAGVLPDVCNYEIDAGIRQWRWLALKPNQLGEDLLDGLVKSMSAAGVLPELNEWASDIVPPRDASSIREWLTRFGLRVHDALKVAGDKRGPTRLIVLLDQMEELFSTTAISDQSRQQLLEAMEVLARSGSVWVLATVRSDFYHHCQTLLALVRMKDGAGLFDLSPPAPDALSRIISGPALLAGLRFEREGEQTLSDTILREAVEHKELLPLLEHLLLELCEHRSADETLTFAHFRKVGGVEGALRRRCEETFVGLSMAAKESLDEVLSELVTLSGDGQETFVRRTVALERFDRVPAQRELINAMVAARLFTTSSDREGGGKESSVVSVAHEALLRVWPRVTQWIAVNRDHLRLRARIEQSQQRWEQQGGERSLLLASGLPLNEGRRLLTEAPHLLGSGTRGYIEASIQRARQVLRTQRTIAAACLVLMSIGGWFAWKTRERLITEGLVGRLMSAEPGELPAIVKELDSHHQLAATFLSPLVSTKAETVEDKRSQLHARLATVSRDRSQVEPLLEELLSNKVAYIGPIRELLQPHAAALTERLQAILRDAQLETKHRFRAGVALAGFVDPEAAWDDQDLQFMARQLIAENAEYQPVLRDNLRPVSTQLLKPLEALFKDAQVGDAMRLGAANGIADFAANQPDLLTRLLADATPEQYEVLYALVDKTQSDPGIAALKQLTAALPPDDMGSVDRIGYGQRRANAAVSLLRLGERETVLPVFNYTDDPEALTQFIFRCKPRGISIEKLLDLLELVTRSVSHQPQGVSPGLPNSAHSATSSAQLAQPQTNPNLIAHARYALMLAIGEYAPTDIPPARRESLVKQLADWYANDPISGIHGASGWLLRYLGEKEIADRVDQNPVPYSPDREWFTLAITVTPTSPPKPEEKPAAENTASETEPQTTPPSEDEGTQQKDESDSTEPAKHEAKPEPLPPRTFYYTFIVFPPGDSRIGSVEDEPERSVKVNDELRHVVNLSRPFALLDREVTFEELIAFSPAYSGFMQQFKAQPSDAGFGPHWYDSVAFCRWLSHQSGLSETDQSYADPESLGKEEYPREPDPEMNWAPRNWPLELDHRGFRLPTESEWEVASRAGARTAYGYGSDIALLGEFGWFVENSGNQVHPPRELRPTFRGAFDLHGNLFEWTHDWYDVFGESAVTDPLGAKRGSYRMFRGGGWSGVAAFCRSAYRYSHAPWYRSHNCGFRLALSPSSQEQVPSGPESRGEQVRGAEADR
jgi:formylglycine-generating enzyme required for sulfatase activity